MNRPNVLSVILVALTSYCGSFWPVSGAYAGDTTSTHALRQIATIDLPGTPGKRFDYLTIDSDYHYLLSAHLGAGLLYVIDLRTNKLVQAIPDCPGVEGVEYVPELKKVYTSNWKDSTIGVIDLRQMKVIKKIPTAEKPDGNTYAAPFHKLYVSDERGKTLAIVDVTQDSIVKNLVFDSETGMPQYDSVSKRVYLNLQDENMFVVIDPSVDSVIGWFPVGDCKGNHGMALDAEHHRAFLVCEENDLLTVLDLDKNAPIAYVPVAEDADVVKFDAGLGRIYVACYSGAISIIQQVDPDHYRKIEDFPVQEKVHSLAVDPETHRVYAPEQQEDGQAVAKLIVYEATDLR
jgi:YVTN family beta-propeller protein